MHCMTEYKRFLSFLFRFPLKMIVSSLIHCIEQFLLIGLISLAIIRAYFTMILASLREAGFSPLIIFLPLGILSVYGCIATIQCRACQQVSADEECGILVIDLEEGLIPKPRFRTPGYGWSVHGRRRVLSSSLMSHQVNYFFLAFSSHNSNICHSRCAYRPYGERKF